MSTQVNTRVLYIDLKNVDLKFKRSKEQAVKEIVACISALMNDDGGKIELQMKTGNNRDNKQIIRIIEQSCISIVGSQVTVSNLNITAVGRKIVCEVKKTDFFITVRYNVYLPTVTQVVAVSSLESIKDTLLNRKSVHESVQLGSHDKTFEIFKPCDLPESKVVQLKCLKDSQSKCTNLVKRMKNNKLTDYVSAFANYNGGHIYYGITDDGIVIGELIPNQNIGKITQEIEKVVKKMIWPEKIGQPKRGEHWEIFFEPVLDEKSKPVPSTFVIVIYVAPCLGGVFAEEPECYEMVEGKVTKMSFATWTKRITVPDDVLTNQLECCGTEEGEVGKAVVSRNEKSEPSCTCQQEIPRAPGNSITWLSTRTRHICITAFSCLTVCLNNAEWKRFQQQSRAIEDKHPEIVEIKLVVLLKKIVARCRKHEFNKAHTLLQEYKDLLQTCTEKRIFELLGLYAKAVLSRCRCNLNNSQVLLANALGKAEWVMPGLVTAIINIFAGTMTDRFDNAFQDNCLCPPDILSIHALQHLQQFVDCPVIRADLEHKAHIILATFYLGCNLSGQLIANRVVDDACLKRAESSIKAVKQSINKGNKLTLYHDGQFNLVKSILHFRYSETTESKSCKRFRLKKAFEFSKSAEKLARECKSDEVVSWSKSLQALYAEKLLRVQLSQLNPRRTPQTH